MDSHTILGVTQPAEWSSLGDLGQIAVVSSIIFLLGISATAGLLRRKRG